MAEWTIEVTRKGDSFDWMAFSDGGYGVLTSKIGWETNSDALVDAKETIDLTVLKATGRGDAEGNHSSYRYER